MYTKTSKRWQFLLKQKKMSALDVRLEVANIPPQCVGPLEL